GISGRLVDVVYDTGVREVSGTGSLSIRTFRTGNIDLTDLEVPDVVAERSTLRFKGSGDLVGSTVLVDGEIAQFHKKPKVMVHATLGGTRLGPLVQMATNQSSPVSGLLDLEVQVDAGGELPRGGAIIQGKVQISVGAVSLKKKTRYMVLDAIRLLPWVDLDVRNRVLLEPMEGRIRFTRGTVTFQEVTYPAGKRQLRLDGTIGDGKLYLVVRLLPFENPEFRPGLGVVLEGTPQQQQFRLATREDLLKPAPWVPFASEEERKEELERLRTKRRQRILLDRLK
ncbi:MAG: hypothetical protein KC656_24695, partial [Myxococcales bacterium]|nr:hypothetical protein [Myxococcales bacterium]